MAATFTVTGSTTNTSLNVLPGVDYSLQIIASNVDGSVVSLPVNFTTLPGGMSIECMHIKISKSTIATYS